MSLDRLVEEIRRRADEELAQQSAKQASDEAAVTAERDRSVTTITEQSRRSAELEVARERAKRLASAKLQARKLVYEAEEARMTAALDATRELLVEYTETDDYPKVIRRMIAYAQDALGKPTKVMGRADDAALLKKLAGTGFDPTPLPILGGVVAQSADGSRRLNLAFDELLRLREDRVRNLLSS